MRFSLHKEEPSRSCGRQRSNSLPGWSIAPNALTCLTTKRRPRQGHNSNSKVRRVSFVKVDMSGQQQCQPCENECGGFKRYKTLKTLQTSTSTTSTSTSTCWWEPDREDSCDTVDFTQETSLHGLKYICQPRRHIVERVFWLLAFLTGLVMAGWLISDVWLNYLTSPLIVTFQPFETTIDKIPFPAVTICNMNKVLKTRAEEFIRAAQGPDNEEKTIEARKNVYYLDHVCASSKSFSQKFNISSRRGQIDRDILGRTRVEDGDDEQRDVASFLQIASQPCSEMLLLCAWQDTIYNCSDLFKSIETDFGKCCTFNMIPHQLLYKNLNDRKYDSSEVTGWSQWDIEKDGLLIEDKEQDPVDQGHAQMNQNGHTHPGQGNHFSPDKNKKAKRFPRRQKRAGKSSGLSVLLNPHLSEYFCTSSDSYGYQLVKHLPIDNPKVVDFGIAIRPNSEVFMGIRPEMTMADRDIRDFKLDKRNCYFHGEFQLAYYKHYTSSNCYDECLANQTYELCGCVSYYMPRDDSRDLCGASSFSCAENVIKSSLQSGIKSRCDFCLPACTELEYFSETTFTPIQNGLDIFVADKNLSSSWTNQNLSLVHIYFASDSTYARVRKELYGITDLIGGLMGLCLGFSGLSLIEVIYFYTLRAWCRTRRRRSMWLIAKMKFNRFWVKKEDVANSNMERDPSRSRCPGHNQSLCRPSQSMIRNGTHLSVKMKMKELDNYGYEFRDETNGNSRKHAHYNTNGGRKSSCDVNPKYFPQCYCCNCKCHCHGCGPCPCVEVELPVADESFMYD